MEQLPRIIAILKEHGAEYTGIQPGIGDIADMVLFRDLATGTSLALPLPEVNGNAIHAKLAIAREKFRH